MRKAPVFVKTSPGTARSSPSIRAFALLPGYAYPGYQARQASPDTAGQAQGESGGRQATFAHASRG